MNIRLPLVDVVVHGNKDIDIDNNPPLLLPHRHLPNRHYSFVNAIGKVGGAYSIGDTHLPV
jgi:hypothetical protein